jgi:hypothetical protein
VWIDVVCIDEEDVKDRAQQMRLLSDIYARASTVIVSAGSSWELHDIYSIFSTSSLISSSRCSNDSHRNIRGLVWKILNMYSSRSKFLQALKVRPRISSSLFQAISDLLYDSEIPLPLLTRQPFLPDYLVLWSWDSDTSKINSLKRQLFSHSGFTARWFWVFYTYGRDPLLRKDKATEVLRSLLLDYVKELKASRDLSSTSGIEKSHTSKRPPIADLTDRSWEQGTESSMSFSIHLFFSKWMKDTRLFQPLWNFGSDISDLGNILSNTPSQTSSCWLKSISIVFAMNLRNARDIFADLMRPRVGRGLVRVSWRCVSFSNGPIRAAH